jgi:glyoxylase-like metal-dependent hydrolase (beta-lactamase superfamily II)
MRALGRDSIGSLSIAATPDILPRVHRLVNSFVNWYLVEADGRLTAVDAGLPGFKGSLGSDLRTLGFRPEDIEAVILTHSDSDHVGLVAVLHEAGARVLIHAVDEPKLRKPGPKSGDAKPINIVPDMWRPSFWRLATSMLLSGGARPTKFENAETFEGGMLDVPGRPRVIKTPGHTPGHCAFHFEDHGALFVGDAMCTWNPLTGRRGPQLMPRSFNESNAAALDSLDAIDAIDADVLLPGHGEPWRDGVSAAVADARSRV